MLSFGLLSLGRLRPKQQLLKEKMKWMISNWVITTTQRVQLTVSNTRSRTPSCNVKSAHGVNFHDSAVNTRVQTSESQSKTKQIQRQNIQIITKDDKGWNVNNVFGVKPKMRQKLESSGGQEPYEILESDNDRFSMSTARPRCKWVKNSPKRRFSKQANGIRLLRLALYS